MSTIGNSIGITQAEIDALYQFPKKIHTVIEEVPDSYLDRDKAWHGIHFLLTERSYGGVAPLANVIFGVTPIGKEDVGYGTALGTSSSAVREIAIVLNTISRSDLARKLVP